jgi:hypothetical protein
MLKLECSQTHPAGRIRWGDHGHPANRLSLGDSRLLGDREDVMLPYV